MARKKNNSRSSAPAGEGGAPGKKKKSNLLFNLLVTLIFFAGVLVLLYPTISDLWNSVRNRELITQYTNVIQELTPEDFSHMWAEAESYNRQHTRNSFVDMFDEDQKYILTHPYDQLLNPSGNNIMGYIEVPKLGQRLAIGHGTGNEVLERGVGHVEGSSLPVGGPGTHSVLAGHRGLPTAKIFSDADQLVKGDKFFLYILDDILAYQIDQIEIVLPNDDTFLQIIDGEDLVTLLTCTPYGVNSHRMLIRGHRIPYSAEDIREQRGQRRISEHDKPVFITVAGIVAVFIILMIMRYFALAKKRRRQREEERRLLQEATETARRAAEEAAKAAKAAEEAREAAVAAQQATERRHAEEAAMRAAQASGEAGQARDAAAEFADTAEDLAEEAEKLKH